VAASWIASLGSSSVSLGKKKQKKKKAASPAQSGSDEKKEVKESKVDSKEASAPVKKTPAAPRMKADEITVLFEKLLQSVAEAGEMTSWDQTTTARIAAETKAMKAIRFALFFSFVCC